MSLPDTESLPSLLAAWDQAMLRALYGSGSPAWFEWLAVGLSVLGSGWSLLVLLPLLVRARWRRLGGSLLLVATSTATLVFLLKNLFRRVRPCQALSGVEPLWGACAGYSFPSGHAAGSFAVAGFVTVLLSGQRRGRLLGVLSIALASCISLSRVYLGAHYPGDVTAGALLGWIAGWGAGRLYRNRARGEACSIRCN